MTAAITLNAFRRGALMLGCALLFCHFTSPARAEPGSAMAGVVAAVRPAESTDEHQQPKRWFRYNSSGRTLGSKDGWGSAKVNLRTQLRFTSPFESAPRKESHLNQPGESHVGFRRARFKMEGHIAAPWIEYKYEHDLTGGNLLDLRFDVGPEWMKVRFGQWKADYSRERMDSSGKQQFVERSIVNREFTIDRQKGIELTGRFAKGSAADSQYFVGVFTGQGRGVFRDRRVPANAADGSPMWLARYQWNALGGGVSLSQSDLERRGNPRLSLAVATSGNRSSYTRFSSSGGGQADGFEAGAPGQYSVRQYLAEVAFKQQGFSLQQEFHWKRAADNVNSREINLRGSYIQAGYFFNELYSKIPSQLELAGRYAFVDPRTGQPNDLIHELGVVANWFLRGHADKISVDVSRYALVVGQNAPRSRVGVRVQWDATF
ncbi:MAG: porin [Acidobacteria bacterium]|nr:porin [Acidobacteriota bacterium]MDA1236804.1 porin [Acidobacteriota bacterium]